MKIKIIFITAFILLCFTGYTTIKKNNFNYLEITELLCNKEWIPVSNKHFDSNIKVSYGTDNVYYFQVNQTLLKGTWFYDNKNQLHLTFSDKDIQFRSEVIANIIKLQNDTLQLMINNDVMTYVWNKIN